MLRRVLVIGILSALFAQIGASFAQSDISHTGQWVRTEKIDAFSGTSYAEFVLTGTFLSAPQNHSDGPPLLVLHCKKGEHHNGKNVYDGSLLSAQLTVGTVLGSQQSGVAAMYRLDDGKPQTEVWSISTSGTVAFFNQMTLDTLLYSHYLPHRADSNPPVKKAVIAVDEAFAARVVMQFDMPDPKEVEQVCGVTYHKP